MGAILQNAGDGSSSGPPLPMKQVMALCFIQLCDFINGGAIYPYIIFMIQSFNLTDDDRKLGYYAGLLASSYYIAQLFSSMVWGIASDKFGRRPCLLVGLVTSMTAVLVFGFSQSLMWAITTRFLCGLFNGNLGVTKTMLGEISTTETQARAFSFFGFTVAASGIVGPLIGGLLSNPSEKYPHVFGGVELFEKYPFCLPNLIAGALSFIGFIIGIVSIPETKSFKAGEEAFFSKLLSKLPFVKPKTKFIQLRDISGIDTREEDDDENEDIQEKLQEESSITITTHKKRQQQQPEEEEGGEQEIKEERESTEEKEKKTGKMEMMRDKGVMITCVMYGWLGLMYVFYEEVTPYWSFLPVDEGGLSFSSSDIGIATSAGCVIGMMFQMFVYPRIANKIGILKAFKIGALITMPGLILVPQSPIIALALTDNRNLATNPVAWTFLLLGILFIQVGGELLFISVMIAISNSALPEFMGTVNGIAQSVVALTRAVAPIAGSSMLSWSLTNGLSFPFNYQLPYMVLVLISLLLIGLTFIAPTSLNMQKKEALLKEQQKLLAEEVP